MDSPEYQDPETVFPVNKKAPPSEVGNSIKNGGMWTLNNNISPTKVYEVLTKIEPKGYTALDLSNIYNHTNIFLNTVNII